MGGYYTADEIDAKLAVDYGLSFQGTVTGIEGAPNFQCAGLVGFGNDYFKGYYVYVVWDAGGGGAQPQGQKEICTGYVSATGDFTVAAFVPNAIAVGDKVLLIHPSVAPTRQLFQMDFWSDSLEEISVDGDTAATFALPSVVIADMPAGATVVRAIAIFMFRMLENTHATIANKLDGATVPVTSQVIQVKESVGGAYIDAINFVDDQFGIGVAMRETGDVVMGSIDVSAEVDGNGTYDLRWFLALADEDNLNFNDIQCGLRIYYSV